VSSGRSPRRRVGPYAVELIEITVDFLSAKKKELTRPYRVRVAKLISAEITPLTLHGLPGQMQLLPDALRFPLPGVMLYLNKDNSDYGRQRKHHTAT
jgi:hypothetical protein